MFLFMLILKIIRLLFIFIVFRLCYIKNMKKILSLFLLPLIISCSTNTSYSQTCYQCFYGNEIELNMTCRYDYIDNKDELQNELSEVEGTYHFGYYVLNTTDDVSKLLGNINFDFSSNDIDTLNANSDQTKIVFVAQIPSGYKAFKRNNFQYRKSENEEIFLTSNFYTYGKRKDIAYCFFDVIKDSEIKENYIYSFVIKVNKDFFEFDSNTSIRGILSDSAYKKEELPTF